MIENRIYRMIGSQCYIVLVNDISLDGGSDSIVYNIAKDIPSMRDTLEENVRGVWRLPVYIPERKKYR